MTTRQPHTGRVICLSPGGFHEMGYRTWQGEGEGRGVICVHGLTRNGRDFDALAQALAGHGRNVVCPDVAGRGESDPLPRAADYGFEQYARDMASLLAHLGVSEVDWIGTSMGGIIGMVLAAQPRTPIRRLVLNDVGPFIPKAALERIAATLEEERRWSTLAEAEVWMRSAYASFGPLTDEQWLKLTRDSVREDGQGGYAANFDPRIAEPIHAAPPADVDLWAVWDAIRCPVLVVRGARSDLLTAATAEQMAERGPRAEIVEIAECGHAPALVDAGQIGVVADWVVNG